ncbi:glycosyltransferase [Cytobacillus firmus]|uniref:CgeB family protein n=1 Tax=Cytobacillus firmus TaxID=1399 RepID=UPI0024C17331|nr:glycosyltransferase [Cytobacillus firmus]WHY33822.1 glycosyltransferase [Cytobacillus firmus]
MNVNIRRKLDEIQRKRKSINTKFSNQFISNHIIEIENSRWYKQSDAPVKYDPSTRTFHSELSEDKHSYLSYQEKNTKFTIPPTVEIINIRPNQRYRAEFNGKADPDVQVSLVMNIFSGEKVINSFVIPINKSKEIELPDTSDNIRLAVRIKGKGSFSIHSIFINDIPVWNLDKNIAKPYIEIENTNWYLPNKSSVKYDKDASLFIFEKNEANHVYIPYYEANGNFGAKPQMPIKIDGENLTVLFEGEKDSSLDVKLFIILYDENGVKKDNHQINLNTRRLIEVSDGATHYRLAIRVSGAGHMAISSIAISGEGYWLTKKIEKIITRMPKTDMIYDLSNELFPRIKEKNKNRLILHKGHNTFESRLKDKQYSYLSCFESSGINEAPKNTIISPKGDYYYELFPKADLAGDVNLTLFIASYRYGERLEIHQVPFNNLSVVRFHEMATDIKVFIRVNGAGIFKDIQIGIDEKEIEILNSLELDLNKDQFFQTSSHLSFTNKGDPLEVQSKIEDDKRIYVSYKEKNNSFNMHPITHLLPINTSSIYEFAIKAKIDGVELIPMIILYSGESKLQVIQLKLNSKTSIQMHPDTTDIRVAFRIAGKGSFILDKFTIVEKPIVNVKKENNWIHNQELIDLKLVKPKPIKKLKMAVIFDVFTTASYKDECELITFTPDNWLETLTNNMPDILMVESAWQGNDGTWNRKVGYYGEENMKPLYGLINWCNENNIPTVFWNKEDPVHFNRFIETAVKFDYIFTTDENMVKQYKEKAGHEDVYALPFAAQPVIHNPIKIVEERENKACFAGSYYLHHEERSEDMNRVLDKAAKYGLEIYDRNYEKNLKGLMPNHQFPERYKPFIKGSLKYYEIDKAYKGYKVMINVNTVKHSPTMFSRRVFEGLACGTPVVSTYAQGIEEIFGDLVYISEKEEEIDNAFRLLLKNEGEYRRKAMLGIRNVLSKHTYTHRLKYITEKANLGLYHELPKVTVVAFASNREEYHYILENFNRQVYKNKELYIIVETFPGYLDLFKQYNNQTVKTFIGSYMSKYKNIMEWIDTPYVSYFSKCDYYGDNYLLDLMLSTTFTDSDVIGKKSYFEINEYNHQLVSLNDMEEYEFVNSLVPSRSIIKTNVFSKESLDQVLTKFKSLKELTDYHKFGKSFYSNDKYNYLSKAYIDGNDSIKDEYLQKIKI